MGVRTETRAHDALGSIYEINIANRDGTPETRQLTWDTNQAIPQIIFDTNTTASNQAEFFYGANRVAYAHARDAVGGSVEDIGFAEFTYDALGNTIGALNVDATGATPTNDYVRANDYDAYGVPRGPLADAQADQLAFGYGGELHIGGLIHLRARDYEPTTGTFLTRDPLGGVDGAATVANLYHYVDNDPIDFADPAGTSPTDKEILVIPEPPGNKLRISPWLLIPPDPFAAPVKSHNGFVTVCASFSATYDGPGRAAQLVRKGDKARDFLDKFSDILEFFALLPGAVNATGCFVDDRHSLHFVSQMGVGDNIWGSGAGALIGMGKSNAQNVDQMAGTSACLDAAVSVAIKTLPVDLQTGMSICGGVDANGFTGIASTFWGIGIGKGLSPAQGGSPLTAAWLLSNASVGPFVMDHKPPLPTNATWADVYQDLSLDFVVGCLAAAKIPGCKAGIRKR